MLDYLPKRDGADLLAPFRDTPVVDTLVCVPDSALLKKPDHHVSGEAVVATGVWLIVILLGVIAIEQVADRYRHGRAETNP